MHWFRSQENNNIENKLIIKFDKFREIKEENKFTKLY